MRVVTIMMEILNRRRIYSSFSQKNTSLIEVISHNLFDIREPSSSSIDSTYKSKRKKSEIAILLKHFYFSNRKYK
jgi:hypothetical protein